MKSSTIKGAVLAAILALTGTLASTAAHAADKVVVQMKWVPQAQFAGYYVAQAKGYYKDAGLDVTIKPGGPDVSPVQVLAGNQADAIVVAAVTGSVAYALLVQLERRVAFWHPSIRST